MEQFESLIADASRDWREGSNQCPHQYEDDFQGACCKRDDNTNGMAWCEPDGCPFFQES